jgi:hypothetical protein
MRLAPLRAAVTILDGSERREAGDVGVPHVAPQTDLAELSLLHDLDEARPFELLQVVRDGGLADAVLVHDPAARHRPWMTREVTENLEPTRLRESGGDSLDVLLGEAGHGV